MTATVAPFSLYLSNDNLLELNGLRNSTAATGTYINDATVTVTLKDASDNEVAGETWPLAVGYVSASDGIYRAILQNTLTITAGASYTAEVSADGDSLQAFWAIAVTAANRVS